MRYRLRTLLIGIAVLGIFLASAREAGRYIKPSISYAFAAEFTELPADDDALTEWFRSQPGVIRAYINREQQTIKINLMISRDLFGHPPIPEPESQWERLGYKGLKWQKWR